MSAGRTVEGEDMAGGSEEEHAEAHRHRFGLTPSQVAASALAASCAALVASYLGVAGTISGAAIGSIVATTGSAFYGRAFHHGSKKVVNRLGPVTFLVSDARLRAATWVRADAAIASQAAVRTAPTRPPGPKRKPGDRTPIALTAATLAVFGAAITVGILAGGPIRQSGTGNNFTPSQTTTRPPPTTRPAGSGGSPTTTADPSAAVSARPSENSSTTPSSASPTPSQPAASQTPTGQATQGSTPPGATGFGSVQGNSAPPNAPSTPKRATRAGSTGD